MSIRSKILFLIYCCLLTQIVYSCQSEREISYAKYYVGGKELYAKHCRNCHGENGEGLGALVPPLSDSTYLKENYDKLSCIIKYGISEKLVIHGKSYQEAMPANKTLANIEIAEIITYITNSFGNKMGLYDVEEVNEGVMNCK